MSTLKVSLFGKFNIVHGEKEIDTIRARKIQELFIYLLIFRKHPQTRESLSEALWTDQPAAISRKNLRQKLWHLQSVLKQFKDSSSLELIIDNGWIHLHLPADFWLDTAEFEQVFNAVNHKRARELRIEDFQAMQYAVSLYKGDLLEGWYQDWCIFDRERFQMMFLMLLDKLVQYCEIHQNYDAGLMYGWQILRHDQAYERAHRQIMRLYFMSGDRTQALHQYERCVNALQAELGVEPSERTRKLYQQIRSDKFQPPLFALEKTSAKKSGTAPAFKEALDHLGLFALALRTIEAQLQQEIAALENVLSGQVNQSSQ